MHGYAAGATYSDTDALTSCEGNLDQPPSFASYDAFDPAGDDFHLAPGSPCIDAGSPTREDADGSPADQGAFGGPGGDWDG